MFKILFKIFFYLFLLVVLFTLCLYQFPNFGPYVDEKTDSEVSVIVKTESDKIIDLILGTTQSINAGIDGVAPRTAGGIEERLENNEKVQ